MFKLKQFRYLTDNFAYLVYDGREAMAVDGGAVEEICRFLREHDLDLVMIANTHSHADHTVGNEQLYRRTGARMVTWPELKRDKRVFLGGKEIKVYLTPGHSEDSVCFHVDDYLLSGDTLFNATVGNCFSGDLKGFYNSIKRLMVLPPRTLVYAGHDYVQMALDFLGQLDRENKAAETYRQGYNPGHVFSRLADELVVNPYLRFNESRMKDILKGRGLPAGSPWQRWLSLMSIE